MDPRERRQHQLFGMVDTRRTDLLRLYRHLTGSKPPRRDADSAGDPGDRGPGISTPRVVRRDGVRARPAIYPCSSPDPRPNSRSTQSANSPAIDSTARNP